MGLVGSCTAALALGWGAAQGWSVWQAMLSLQMDRVPTRIARRSFARSHYAHFAVSMLMLATAGVVALYRMNVQNSKSARNDPGKFARMHATLLREKAADGDTASQLALAEHLLNGRWGTRDESGAARWNKAAAEGGDATAQFRIARALASGEGIALDAAQAMDWMKKAAEQGLPDAQMNYGVYLFMGLGGERSLVDGYRWIARAAESGSTSALVVRDQARREMTPEQLKAAETLP